MRGQPQEALGIADTGKSAGTAMIVLPLEHGFTAPGVAVLTEQDMEAYAAALTAATATIGPIIPPSIIMVIYALTDSRADA